jgi:hypothetical protein
VGAVGPHHYVQMINAGIEVWSKDGTVLVSSMPHLRREPVRLSRGPDVRVVARRVRHDGVWPRLRRVRHGSDLRPERLQLRDVRGPPGGVRRDR